MPAFDPVRDAVRSSPTEVGPGLARRATDLSVLLNDDNSAPAPTPAHADYDSATSPLPRPPQQRQQRQGTLASSPSTFSLPPKPVQASPPPRSHEQGQARSRGTPYAPTRRFTQPASSLLMPLTPAEADLYAEWMTRGGLGARLLKSKKSQGHQQSGAQSRERPVKKSKDVGLVVEHYNARPDVGPDARRQSPIIGLKSFNNWVKSVLIQRFAHPALAASPSAGRHTGGSGHAEAMSRNGRSAKGGKVLDMGCGKGGDLIKWAKSPVREYVGLDIAAVSVEQARGRYQTLKGSPFLATFAALDCYTHPLSAALTPAQLSVPFDVVSMQFCMHYAFETVQKVRRMLENVSKWLRPGGIFLGTVPNADILLSRLDELPPDAEDLSFGNSVYKITFEDRVKRPIFGHRYSFFLKDAVEDVPEYIVHWDNFTQMAAEYGLHQVYKEEFHHVFTEHQTDPEFGQLLVRMKVADKDGNSQMDEDQWEAANIYLAFAFEKR
ncbi:guanine-N(7)-methyltransferase [Punctularia strigosozonata HHB-11173 SS5]|uniref:guanine-N(7)-methyltransferase n=1 Tax=Punctularia strigosozonata (strain HHB-11173) TaxID=741275 RepID=UPI0004418583|nr:guanine-N(7)-methyltransferase [Punctularia strigosozonata HHB-11173 SS5]EIN08070.1 guanine-N(7)-methyltransferase [Punctularia strigosozonata HHB-11173 SS5]